MSSIKQMHKARRRNIRRLGKLKARSAPTAGKDWVDMVDRESQRNEDRQPQFFDWYKLMTQAMWMLLALLQADPPPPCDGTVLLMSKNQVEICFNRRPPSEISGRHVA